MQKDRRSPEEGNVVDIKEKTWRNYSRGTFNGTKSYPTGIRPREEGHKFIFYMQEQLSRLRYLTVCQNYGKQNTCRHILPFANRIM